MDGYTNYEQKREFGPSGTYTVMDGDLPPIRTTSTTSDPCAGKGIEFSYCPRNNGLQSCRAALSARRGGKMCPGDSCKADSTICEPIVNNNTNFVNLNSTTDIINLQTQCIAQITRT